MPSSLASRAFAVTGGFGALGTVLGEAIMQAGARVALIGRGRAPPDVADGALALSGVDLGDAAAARAAMDQAARHFGRLDGLVNVAGGFEWEKIEGGDIGTWERMFAINVRTALLASQAALPHLLARGSGRIAEFAQRGMPWVGRSGAVKRAFIERAMGLAGELPAAAR